VAGTSQKPIVQDTPAFGRRPTPASSFRRSVPSHDSPLASTSGSRSSSNERGTRATNKHSLGPDSSPRPPKRVRTDSDEPPSLLSRLASKGTEYRPNVARVGRAVQENAVSAPKTDREQIPQGGYSIKGAAKASSESHHAPPTSSSLLNRIIMDDAGGGGRSDGGIRRKYPR
jgi:hypothetical protein